MKKKPTIRKPIIVPSPKIDVLLSAKAIFTIVRQLDSHGLSHPYPRGDKFVDKYWEQYSGGLDFKSVEKLIDKLIDAHTALKKGK